MPSPAPKPSSRAEAGSRAAAGLAMAAAVLAAGLLGSAPARAGGPAESPAEHVSNRILESRCSAAAIAARDGEVDPICHRTLAPGDSARAMQRAERDRGLLAAYRDVDTLLAMRDRQIADIAAQIELARRRMVALHRELEALRMRAQVVGGPRAAEWMEQARTRALAILAEEELIKARRAEQERVHERFERDARRLRMLLSALQSAPAELAAPVADAPAGTPGAAAAAALAPYPFEHPADRGPLAQR